MSSPQVVAAHRLLAEAVEALRAAAGSGADEALLGVLAVAEGVTRQLDRVVVDAIATLERRGVFAARGYRNSATALVDLVGWERAEARRRLAVADAVGARTGIDGTPLPPRLPATARAFTGGAASSAASPSSTRRPGSTAPPTPPPPAPGARRRVTA